VPFPPFPSVPSPNTYTDKAAVSAPLLRSDVNNAVLLLTQPPMFAASQTGNPTPFTAASSDSTFTSAGIGYANGNSLALSGASLPGGFSAGTLYNVVSASGQAFQLAPSSGGSAITVTSDGSGTATLEQLVATGVWTPVTLDTTGTDPWAGHLTTSNEPIYYGMFPGYYLCEFWCPLSYTGGSGTVAAGISGQEGTGPVTTYGGQSMPNSGTSNRFNQPSVAKILAFSVTGDYGAAGNNYAQGMLWQDSGSQQQPLVTATRYPAMQAEWLAGLGSNAGLPVPDVDPWPPPPTPVSATFLNKNIRDTISFLAGKPLLEAYYAAGTQTLASQSSIPATGTTVNLDTVYIDTYSAFSASTHTWTAPVPGLYFCYGQAPVTGGSGASSVACGLTITSANYGTGSAFTLWSGAQTASTSSGEVNCAAVRCHLRLNAGDTISLAAFQQGATSPHLQASGVWQCRLITVWRAR
jgi:hypothetical protein